MIFWHIACIASAGFPEEACCFAPLFPKNRLFCYEENQISVMKRRKCHAKTYVLDTNVLIQAPYALQSFEDNHLVLPLAVLEELDGLKNAEGERGANARQAIRYLESLRTAGNLLEGVPLPGGGTLRLEVNCVDVKLPEGFPDHKNDNRILKVCLGLQNRKTPVILVTKDIVVRVKAQMLGIQAEDFHHRAGACQRGAVYRPVRGICSGKEIRGL